MENILLEYEAMLAYSRRRLSTMYHAGALETIYSYIYTGLKVWQGALTLSLS